MDYRRNEYFLSNITKLKDSEIKEIIIDRYELVELAQNTIEFNIIKDI